MLLICSQSCFCTDAGLVLYIVTGDCCVDKVFVGHRCSQTEDIRLGFSSRSQKPRRKGFPTVGGGECRLLIGCDFSTMVKNRSSMAGVKKRD